MADISRTEVLKDEFQKLGYTLHEYAIAGITYTKFVAPDGATWLCQDNRGMFPFPYVGSTRLLVDKMNSKEYVRDVLGLTTAAGMIIEETGGVLPIEAYRQTLRVGDATKLVAKPVDGSLSRGLTMNISTDEELARAVDHARGYASQVLVEEQVEGEEYRFGFVGNKLCSIVHKERPTLVGDGESTVAELIWQENRVRRGMKNRYVTYPMLTEDVISGYGVDLAEIPKNRDRLTVGESTMIDQGASYWEVLDDMHESYIEIAKKLAGDFGGGYLAVDVLIRDRKDLATPDNYCFLEYNNFPTILVYYGCRNKNGSIVGAELAAYIDKAIHISQ